MNEIITKCLFPVLYVQLHLTIQTCCTVTFKTSFSFSFKSGPRGRTFWWWGCYGLCLRHKPAELVHSFLLCSCVHVCLYGSFNYISFHKFSRQLSVFSFCSSSHISVLLVLSTIYLVMKVPFNFDVILCG